MLQDWFTYESKEQSLGEDFYSGATLKKDVDDFKAGDKFKWISYDAYEGTLYLFRDGKQYEVKDFEP